MVLLKKYIIQLIIVLYSFFGANMLFAAANTWTQKADFGGTARNKAAGFSIGSKGYIGTGNYGRDFWEYNSASNTWTQKADFGGTGRSYATGFSIGIKGYLGLGWMTKDFWEYDPATNTWTQKADFGGIGRSCAVGFSIDNKGYMGLGYDGSSELKDFWEYDPATNTWTQKADFGGTARESVVGFSIGSKGYVGTGWNGSAPTKDFWEYDPSTNTWTQKADFGGAARSEAVGFSIVNKGYIGPGMLDDSTFTYTKDFWEYDPVANTWTRKSDFGGTGRWYSVGFSIGSKGYIGTGSDGSLRKDFWEYDSGIPDTIPNQITFADQTNVALTAIVTSNTITVSGINAAASISIIGGTYSINGGAYTSASSTVNNGDTIVVRQTSSGSYSTTTNATLTIGGVSDTFSVTTLAAFTLTVTKSSAGVGSITPSSGTIAWSSAKTGTASYVQNTSVTLTATPASGSAFSSWTGCDSTNSNTCSLAMTTSKNVTAIFIDIYGDINGEGAATIMDAILALQITTGIKTTGSLSLSADVNNDSKIGVEEVIYILQKVAGAR